MCLVSICFSAIEDWSKRLDIKCKIIASVFVETNEDDNDDDNLLRLTFKTILIAGNR
jgi:hypothetical protein